MVTSFNIVITVHKYEESNVDFNVILYCCKLSDCVISLARQFHMSIVYYTAESK